MADEKRGSGITTRAMTQKLREVVTKQFRDQLGQMSGGRVGFKKKQVEDMVAGFEAGAATVIEHLEKMGVFVYVDVAPVQGGG
jgi:uncharacterized protein YbbK (DUF523 family)